MSPLETREVLVGSPGELAGFEEMLDACESGLKVGRVGNTHSRV